MEGFAAGGFGPGGGGRGGAIVAAPTNTDFDLGQKSAARAKTSNPRSSRNPGNARFSLERDYEGDADGEITIREWDPETPYPQAIKDAYRLYKTKESLYAEYIKQREDYRNSPAFYFDCANLFFKEKQPKLALRILSNLSEPRIDDVDLVRVYAWRLREAGNFDNAIIILRKVAKIRPDEVISWRDLALTLTMRGKEKKNAEDVQEALELFHKTIFTPWTTVNKREGDNKATALIALEEFNELVAWTKRQKWSKSPKIPEVDSVFLKNLDMDIRIMMAWDTDNTDIDIHVIDPHKEEVYFDHQLSRSGGMVSEDMVSGYGPEEYLHRIAPKGKYKVKTKYYSSHQERLVGPATITVTFYTNWGRSNQKVKTMTLRLNEEKETVTAGEIVLR